MTLQPHQFQIGNCVFGRSTKIPVSKVDLQSYNVNTQDFQVIRTDETRFGIDTLVPATITFTGAVKNNWYLPNLPADAATPQGVLDSSRSLLGPLLKEWKGNDVRPFWGVTKPLYFCDDDGVLRLLYGRPGKITHDNIDYQKEFINFQAEFRRGDTYAHSAIEFYVGDATDASKGMAPGAAPVLASRLDGDADAWVRFLFTGPMTHPLVTYGGETLELDLTISDGVQLEVNSYPWTRRVVDTNGINWRSQVIGDTLYLDQLKFLAGTEDMPVSWTAQDGSTNADSSMFFLWREAYNVV